MSITTRGFVFPVVGNIEAAVDIDNQPCATGCSAWRFPEGLTTTYGIDLGAIRLRLVLGRLTDGRRPTEGWGPI
jgi:hypothetical protein